MSDLFAGWLEQAGASVLRRPDGSVPFGIEISPLVALDAAELRGKVAPGTVVDRPLAAGPGRRRPAGHPALISAL